MVFANFYKAVYSKSEICEVEIFFLSHNGVAEIQRMFWVPQQTFSYFDVNRVTQRIVNNRNRDNNGKPKVVYWVALFYKECNWMVVLKDRTFRTYQIYHFVVNDQLINYLYVFVCKVYCIWK